jgi:hypothetical protein
MTSVHNEMDALIDEIENLEDKIDLPAYSDVPKFAWKSDELAIYVSKFGLDGNAMFGMETISSTDAENLRIMISVFSEFRTSGLACLRLARNYIEAVGQGNLRYSDDAYAFMIYEITQNLQRIEESYSRIIRFIEYLGGNSMLYAVIDSVQDRQSIRGNGDGRGGHGEEALEPMSTLSSKMCPTLIRIGPDRFKITYVLPNTPDTPNTTKELEGMLNDETTFDFHMFPDTKPRIGKYARKNGLIDCILNSPHRDVSKFFTSSIITHLIDDATTIFSVEQNIIDIELGDGVTIVGDIHGQLNDLVFGVLTDHIRRKNDADRKLSNNTLIFLGDYVDRGSQNLEVIMLILAMKIEWPTKVFIIRGNHESAQMTATYGFREELSRRLIDLRSPGETYMNIYSKFCRMFSHMPWAGILHGPVDGNADLGKSFLCHGGIGLNLLELNQLTQLNNVTRSEFDKYDSADSGGYAPIAECMTELLWSDPIDSVETRASDRGAGYCVGSADRARFVKKFGFARMFRAHQCVNDGCEITSDNLSWTVFSASMYCGAQNYGAVVNITPTGHAVRRNYKIHSKIYNYIPSGAYIRKVGAASREPKPDHTQLPRYFNPEVPITVET